MAQDTRESREARDTRTTFGPAHQMTAPTAELLRQLVAHLRQNRTQLREEWARRITEAKLLTAMT
ncbi:MAG: hypothetical protein WA855_08490, partial [Candidatus Acidiferrales bacterium]